MLDKIYFILFTCCIALLNGCSFTSQSRSISPYFDGQLKFNDKAIANAKILLSIKAGDKYCLHAKKITSTDKQGKFNLKALSENYTYTPFADQQLDEWTVCAKYNDRTYTLYSNNQYGSGNVTGSVYLHCDLASNTLCTASH